MQSQTEQVKREILKLRQELQFWRCREAELQQRLNVVKAHIREHEERIYTLQDLPAKIEASHENILL